MIINATTHDINLLRTPINKFAQINCLGIKESAAQEERLFKDDKIKDVHFNKKNYIRHCA